MEKKRVSIMLLLVLGMLTLAFNIQTAKTQPPKTIVVPDDYPTIQEAIDHAYSSYQGKEADTVYVRAGTYYENIVVNMSKHYLTLIGEDPLTTIIDGGSAGSPVVTIRDVVLDNFTGFTVRNSGGDASGIYIYNATCEMSGNIIRDNYQGVNLYHSFVTSVYHNNLIDNTQQALVYESANIYWDNGYPSGGNYWSDYTDVDLFSGPNQDELGSDGIWDHPYVIDVDNMDRYPFTQQDGWEAPPPPPPPPVPEFPTGLALELLFIPVIIYTFWRSTRKTLKSLRKT